MADHQLISAQSRVLAAITLSNSQVWPSIANREAWEHFTTPQPRLDPRQKGSTQRLHLARSQVF